MPMTIDGSTTQVVTLDEFKDYVNVESSRNDAELLMMLDAAVEAVEGIVGPILHATVVETLTTQTTTAVLQRWPVVSVTSLTGAGATPVTYISDLASGLLLDVASHDQLTVTYVVGRTVVPEAVRLAILIIAGHLWKTQLGSAPNNFQQPDEFTPDVGLGYAIPSRAQDLLAPYALPPTVA